MPARYKTRYGIVQIDTEVVARVAGMAALECYGVVGMAFTNYKDGIVQILRGDSLTKGIKVETSGEKTSIEFHIVVEYGTNISAIADNLISNVKYKVRELLGVSVENVNVCVDGIRIEKNVKG